MVKAKVAYPEYFAGSGEEPNTMETFDSMEAFKEAAGDHETWLEKNVGEYLSEKRLALESYECEKPDAIAATDVEGNPVMIFWLEEVGPWQF